MNDPTEQAEDMVERLQQEVANLGYELAEAKEWNKAAKESCAIASAEILKLREALREADAGLFAVNSLMESSHGVMGLHLNGDLATWQSLCPGGEFSMWLEDLDTALSSAFERKAATEQQKGGAK